MQYSNTQFSLAHRLMAGWRAFLIHPQNEEALSKIRADFLSLKTNKNTHLAYRSDLQQFFDFLDLQEENLGALLAKSKAELQTDVQRFLSGITKRDILGEYIVNGWTLNRKLYTLAGFFEYLQDTYEFPFNPTRIIASFPVPKHSNAPVLTKDEIWKLMTALKGRQSSSKVGVRNFLLILGLFHFALRKRELAKLQWDHIKMAPIPHLRLRQKGNTFKYLPIPDEYLALLIAYRKRFPSKSPFIFRPFKNNVTKTLEKPLSTEGIRQIVKKIGDEFFPDRHIVPHSFRATFICLARESKIDDKSILNSTGQSDSRMLNYYDVRSKLIANAVLFFGNWIGKY